jgi:hypothetical protein
VNTVIHDSADVGHVQSVTSISKLITTGTSDFDKTAALFLNSSTLKYGTKIFIRSIVSCLATYNFTYPTRKYVLYS